MGGVSEWSTEGWLADATAWLDEALVNAGIARTGAVEQPRIRPWATLLCAPTGQGRVWLKACAASTAAEVALYAVLSRTVPEQVLEPIALDRARGWILLPDGGATLRDRASGDALIDGLATALPAYARLQLAVTGQADELLGLGVPDMRAAVLPERFEEALEVTQGGDHRSLGAHDDALHQRLAAQRDHVAASAEELAASPVPPSLDHNDLHAGNVLVDGLAPRFYDWGDSVVAHPFASMHTTLTVARDLLLKCSDDDPRLARLRNAYLAPFAEAHETTAAALVPTLELACHLGKIARCLTWQRAIDSYRDEPPPPDWAAAPLATLAALLDDSPYGGA